MGGISANRDGDNHGDILSRGMKDRALGEGLIINCSSSCSNREIKSGERRRGGETNPARKNLSLCAVPYTSPLRVSVSAHTDAYVTSTRSYIRMRDRKPLPPSFLSFGIGIHQGPFRSLPPVPFCTLARSRGPEKRRNKNNKKCFLPFRLCISHLALSSLSIFFSLSLLM